jgi:hypothetical protein
VSPNASSCSAYDTAWLAWLLAIGAKKSDVNLLDEFVHDAKKNPVGRPNYDDKV